MRLRNVIERSWLACRMALPTRFVRSPYGFLLRKRPGEFVFASAVRRTKPELFIFETLKRIDGRFTFLDIGANFGAYALLAHQLPSCTAVFAFEPVPETFAHLVDNIARNGATKVVPIAGAISGAAIARLDFNPAHSGMAHLSGGGTVLAPTIGHTALEAILAGRADRRIVAKIDVEGAETSVLDELAQVSAFADLTDILIEVKDHPQNPAGHVPRLLGRLDKLGFERIAAAHDDVHFRRR